LELKLEQVTGASKSGYAYNRTILELKLSILLSFKIGLH